MVDQQNDRPSESPKPKRNAATKIEQKKEESESEEEVNKSEDK